MDRGEPTLVPEWLKISGSAGAGGNNHSPFHPEDHSKSKHSRHKSSNSSSGRETGRSSNFGRTTSPYFCRSSSTKDSSYSRSRGSSARYHCDRVSDGFRDKDKSVLAEHRYHEYADHPDDLFLGGSNEGILRHSRSMISRKPDVTFPRKVSRELSDGSSNHINSSTPELPRASMPSSTPVSLGKDFPSLRTEQEQDSSELRRTPSPGLATTIQSFPGASSNVIGTERWTSSLAEVPGPIGSSSTGSVSSQQTVSTRTAPLAERANGLNMAEAVVQNPSRSRTPPQLSVDTQRLEELAIKQYRQLIPMTPSMPKSISLSPLDKSKSKTMQQSPFSPARLDAAKTPNLSKLQILKSSRELNGVSSSLKERPGPRNGFSSPLSQSPSGASAASALNRKNNPFNSQIVAAPDRRTAAPSILEKKQSRRNFLDQMKKQNSGAAAAAARTDNSPSIPEKSDDSIGVVAHPPEASSSVASGSKPDLPALDLPTENGCKMTENGNCTESGGEATEDGEFREGAEDSDFDVPPPDEKEAKFLLGLGWKEGAEDYLTPEEIRSFQERLAKTTLPSELRRLQLDAVNGSSLRNLSDH